MRESQHVDVSRLTSFQHDGQVPQLIVFEQADELAAYVRSHDLFFILGKGSNTLIDVAPDFPPILQLSSAYKATRFVGEYVEAGAGVGVNQLMAFSKETGFSGFEFMAGVPASVGGMVAMNFGCWGKEIADILVSVEVLLPDGSIVNKAVSDLDFSYRHSIFQQENWIVLSALFKGSRQSPEQVKADILDKVKSRLNTQPLRDKTFGSVFRNPQGLHAAALLEACGFKGYQKGPVMFSKQHANFMINNGGASYKDAVSLIKEATQTVEKKTGVRLRTEVVLLQA